MDISTNAGKRPRVPNGIITQEEANELAWEALDCYPDEPEGFVKLLVILYDNTTDNYLQEAIYRIIRAAFNISIVHSFTLQDYMAAIREGRNPLEEARTRYQASQAEAGDETNKPNKRKRNLKHRKTRS
jgi:hypothetical protein